MREEAYGVSKVNVVLEVTSVLWPSFSQLKQLLVTELSGASGSAFVAVDPGPVLPGILSTVPSQGGVFPSRSHPHKTRTMTAAKNLTTRPQQHLRSLNNEIVSRQMITEINAEWGKSDRLTVAKLNTVKHFNKQDHKSKLMTEKYSLLPLNLQQLTPVQTAIQRMSEKHLDYEIEPVNTI